MDNEREYFVSYGVVLQERVYRISDGKTGNKKVKEERVRRNDS